MVILPLADDAGLLRRAEDDGVEPLLLSLWRSRNSSLDDDDDDALELLLGCLADDLDDDEGFSLVLLGVLLAGVRDLEALDEDEVDDFDLEAGVDVGCAWCRLLLPDRCDRVSAAPRLPELDLVLTSCSHMCTVPQLVPRRQKNEKPWRRPREAAAS